MVCFIVSPRAEHKCTHIPLAGTNHTQLSLQGSLGNVFLFAWGEEIDMVGTWPVFDVGDAQEALMLCQVPC